MLERLRVAIVVIGDEILSGFVQDTNSGWLAGRLQSLGVPLERIVTVPDDVDAIAATLADEFARARPRLVLSSGGIGSTPDDRTIDAVAAWLGVGVVAHPELERRVDALARRAATTGDQHREALRRMARVPAGAELLPGVAGIAPGVVVHRDGGVGSPSGATLVILPGVPSQLRRIMIDGIEPSLLAGRGEPQHVAELTHPYPESAVTPLLDDIVRNYPQVHVGSYPGYRCLLRLIGDRDQVEAARADVVAFLDQLGSDPVAVASSRDWQRHWDDS